LKKIIQGIELKKKKTFPQPTIMEIQEQLKPTINELKTELKKEIEVMIKCINEDYSNKEKELEKMNDNEINNFVDGYEYRIKQLFEMMGFLIGVFEKACNNEKEMLEELENDSKLADIVKYIKECEEEEIQLKEKEEMLRSKYKEEKSKEDKKEEENKNEKNQKENEDEKDKKEDKKENEDENEKDKINEDEKKKD
jgi:uncharacterized protein YlxP (DUF503 family)